MYIGGLSNIAKYFKLLQIQYRFNEHILHNEALFNLLFYQKSFFDS